MNRPWLGMDGNAWIEAPFHAERVVIASENTPTTEQAYYTCVWYVKSSVRSGFGSSDIRLIGHGVKRKRITALRSPRRLNCGTAKAGLRLRAIGWAAKMRAPVEGR